MWFIPGHGLAIRQDEELLLNACHTETSTSYTLKPRVPRTEVTNDNLDAGNFQLLLPPERIAIYGDHEWRHDMLTALQNTVRSLNSWCSFASRLTFCLPDVWTFCVFNSISDEVSE